MLALKVSNVLSPYNIERGKMITSFILAAAAGNGVCFITNHMNSVILTLIVKMSFGWYLYMYSFFNILERRI